MPQVVVRRKNRLLRMLTAYTLIAVAIVVVFGDSGTLRFWGHARQFTEAFATSLLFGLCIGPATGFAMPRLAPYIWSRLRFPFNWIAIAAAMTLFALAGSAVAIGILILIGYIPVGSFWHWYVGSMRVAVVVTLTIGLFITAHEMNVARLERAAAQTQLSSLESRVQPHFLFNTLNSIAALTHEDPAGAERMTTQLASLLRSSLETGDSPWVRLEDELVLVRSYLDIERVRFGQRLRFTIDADAAPVDGIVPRMAIQTLVENSVKYAVSPRREGATIVVRAALDGGRLRVEVRDDGPGFDAAHLPDGHGLALLRARLEALFGHRASLRIDGSPGATSVSIDVPHEHLVLRKRV